MCLRVRCDLRSSEISCSSGLGRGPNISNMEKVGEQKSERKIDKPGHTKRAKRGGGCIYIYMCMYVCAYICILELYKYHLRSDVRHRAALAAVGLIQQRHHEWPH